MRSDLGNLLKALGRLDEAKVCIILELNFFNYCSYVDMIHFLIRYAYDVRSILHL